MATRSWLLVVVVVVFANACDAGRERPPTTRSVRSQAGRVVWRVDREATYRVMREDGSRSLNRTDLRWGVFGADTGSMFSYRGKTYTLYQDNFGAPTVPFGSDFFSVAHADWRSQTLAISRDDNPADGLTIDSTITDKPGHAKELLHSPHDSVENTLAPSYGIAIGDRMFMHYLSIKTEGPDFLHWVCNASGMAYSDDGGRTWVKGPPIWPGNSNFSQVAIVQDGAFVYSFGVPCISPRGGGVQLARVPTNRLLDRGAYRYWTGRSWSPTMTAAATIVPPDVWQFSVRYNSYYKQWLLMSGARTLGVHLYSADAITGPWSQPQTVLPARTNDPVHDDQGYAPMLTPRWNDGPDIWFTVSNIHTYDVSLWHTALTPAGAPATPTSLSASPTKTAGTATITWRAPTTKNASPVTGYVVTPYYARDPSYQERFSLPPVTFATGAISQTITGLKTGTTYTFTVAATNASGTGPSSAPSDPITAS